MLISGKQEDIKKENQAHKKRRRSRTPSATNDPKKSITTKKEDTIQTTNKSIKMVNQETATIPENCVRVSLQRGSNGYGFSIIGGVDQPYLANDSGIFITRIGRKGTAASDGTLAIGDKIVSVNGESCEGAKHQDVLEMFHKSSERVELVIRPHAESLLRQDLAAKQAQDTKNKVTLKQTAIFMTKSSIVMGALYYALKKFEIINARGKLMVPLKEAPRKLFSEMLALAMSYIPKSLKK